MVLPADSNILLSLINMKLRDKYSSLDELCEEEELDKDEVCALLANIGFGYDRRVNSFINSELL